MNLRLKELYTLYSVQELAEHCLHEESENKILNNRIDKAIEYIKSNYIDNPIEFKKDLLKILKGSDKDENN